MLLFFNLGGGEIVVIMLVILLFFGAKRIPELARGLGKGMREFKNAANDIQREIQQSTNIDQDKKKDDARKNDEPSASSSN
ncbi:MAG: twin-arginine translocase TatA/TatE family subunit [Flavobacteriales bacterium]|nr:twin-arginine translocase TatA/TatE family subunit [Flavobacteriales bacterium]